MPTDAAFEKTGEGFGIVDGQLAGEQRIRPFYSAAPSSFAGARLAQRQYPAKADQ